MNPRKIYKYKIKDIMKIIELNKEINNQLKMNQQQTKESIFTKTITDLQKMKK